MISAGWLLRRALLAFPVMAGVTALSFILIHLAPGDPIYFLAGDGGSPDYYADMRAKYGLDRPLAEQAYRYARAVLTADLGYSFLYQAPVTRVIAQHAPASFLLGVTALLLATVGGFVAGVVAAMRAHRLGDVAIRATASVAYAAPVFWIGQILIIVFAVELGLLPVGGLTTARADLSGLAYAADVARHLLLPAITLALPFMAVVARVTRAAVLDALATPFVVAAQARGLSRRRIVWRHATAMGLVPVVALIGEQAAGLAAGAALTEALFGWPGLGFLVLHGSQHRDYPLVIALLILVSGWVVVMNAATDLMCAAADPRAGATR